MKINAVISYDKFKRNGFIKDKTQLLCFFVILFAYISGIALYISSEEHLAKEMYNCFNEFCYGFSSKTKPEVFSGIFLSHLPYLLFMVVFGTSSVGFIFAVVISYFKISGLGMISAYLYSSLGLKGIEYALLIFYPGKLIMIFSILFAMHTSTNQSLYVKGLIKGEYNKENSSNLYIIKMVTAVMLFVISSLIDCFLAASFSSLFVF